MPLDERKAKAAFPNRGYAAKDFYNTLVHTQINTDVGTVNSTIMLLRRSNWDYVIQHIIALIVAVAYITPLIVSWFSYGSTHNQWVRYALIINSGIALFCTALWLVGLVIDISVSCNRTPNPLYNSGRNLVAGIGIILLGIVCIIFFIVYVIIVVYYMGKVKDKGHTWAVAYMVANILLVLFLALVMCISIWGAVAKRKRPAKSILEEVAEGQTSRSEMIRRLDDIVVQKEIFELATNKLDHNPFVDINE